MGRSMNPGSFRPSSPFHMVWLATNRCNARCAHCSSNSSTPYPDELSQEEACDLMDQFAEAGVVDLAISGGEPLLRQDLFEIIAHARSRGLSVGVGSNGAVLSQETAIRLVESGINRFQVSLDGQAAEHEALRCWNGLFDRALQMIQRAREVGLRVHVCCTINRLNWQILESFTELVSRLGVSRLNYSRFVPTGRGSEALDLSPKEWRAVILLCGKLKELYKGKLEIVSHLAQQILVDAEIKNMPGFIGCQAGIGQGAVSANGYVFPCVLLPIPLGNIREKRFLEIWQTSPVIQALQNRDNLRGHCSECNLRERCGGCRAVAYAKTGDYLESDPRCWLMPDAKAEINSNLETKEAICYV